jgi:hypothetical protein
MEFVIGNKFCTICLIGISVKGDPLAGIMYQPFEGMLLRSVFVVQFAPQELILEAFRRRPASVGHAWLRRRR